MVRHSMSCVGMRANACIVKSYTEHRDKLHGTLSTFDAVDKKIRGIVNGWALSIGL